MIRDDCDASWERFGLENPYYGVLTDEKFRQENLTDELKAEFFESGRVHIEKVFAMALSHFGVMASRKSALDFGCGVGRIVIPLAQMFDHVTGVDISPAMLRAAEQNCSERGIRNVDFVVSDDELSKVTDNFDFIHSFIVLQHIPVRRGDKIIKQLLDRLSHGGIVAIQFPFMHKASVIRKSISFLRKYFAPFSLLGNIVQGKRWNEPFMQMNSYDVNGILMALSERGIKDVVLEVTDSGKFLSAFVFAKKIPL